MIINNFQKNSPNFTSLIYICNDDEVKKHYNNSVKVSKNKNSKNIMDEARFGKKIGTVGIRMCCAGGITGQATNNNKVFHLFAGLKFSDIRKRLVLHIKSIDAKFKETVNRLKKRRQKATCSNFWWRI